METNYFGLIHDFRVLLEENYYREDDRKRAILKVVSDILDSEVHNKDNPEKFRFDCHTLYVLAGIGMFIKTTTKDMYRVSLKRLCAMEDELTLDERERGENRYDQ